MDPTSVLLMALQTITGAFGVVLWTMLNNIRNKSDKTEAALADYKVIVANSYLTKTEMKEYSDSLKQSFERHANRIDLRLDRLEERILEMKDKNNRQ